MKGRKLKYIRKRLGIHEETAADLLSAPVSVLKGWEDFGDAELPLNKLQSTIAGALDYVCCCTADEDALKFGSTVDTWIRLKGLGFALHCVLSLQYSEEKAVEVGCD